MKIKLERNKGCYSERVKQGLWVSPTHSEIQLKESLPFFRSYRGAYIHRIRSATINFREGVASHATYRYWCNNHGSITLDKSRVQKIGSLFAEVPAGSVVCATCEGRFIGSGTNGPPLINGVAVKFAPKMKSKTSPK